MVGIYCNSLNLGDKKLTQTKYIWELLPQESPNISLCYIPQLQQFYDSVLYFYILILQQFHRHDFSHVSYCGAENFNCWSLESDKHCFPYTGCVEDSPCSNICAGNLICIMIHDGLGRPYLQSTLLNKCIGFN